MRSLIELQESTMIVKLKKELKDKSYMNSILQDKVILLPYKIVKLAISSKEQNSLSVIKF